MGDRFISPERPPEGREREILEILAEEAAEVIQRVTKALRFGLAEVQHGQPHTNAERLAHEIGDFLVVMDHALTERLITYDAVGEGEDHKREQLAKYMQHQHEEDKRDG